VSSVDGSRSAGPAHLVPENWQRVRAQKAALENELALWREGRRRQEPTPDYLFICGCPRSGTTATANLLNRDPRIAMGLERFKYIDGHLRPHHFLREYFLNPTLDETNILRYGFYDRLRRKFEAGSVALVGDKLPARDGAAELQRVAAEFPGSRFLFVLRELRDVAASFVQRAADPSDPKWPSTYDHRHAVRRWNHSLRALRGLISTGDVEGRVFILDYERFFSGEVTHHAALYRFLALEPTTAVNRAYAEAVAGWSERLAGRREVDPAIDDYLKAKRDRDDERWVRELAARARNQQSGV
jgi:hypothetical protein